MKMRCELCRNTFYAPPSQRARFCSRKCYDEYRVGRFVCCECGVEFTYYKSHKRGDNAFCSHECHFKYIAKDVKNHPRWRGGRAIHSGYISIWTPGKRVKEHRFIMGQHVGRPLRSDEIVHHINHDKTDNRIENLMITTRSEHCRIHKPRRGTDIKK